MALRIQKRLISQNAAGRFRAAYLGMLLFRGFVFRRHLAVAYQTLQLSTKKALSQSTEKISSAAGGAGGDSSSGQVCISVALFGCITHLDRIILVLGVLQAPSEVGCS